MMPECPHCRTLKVERNGFCATYNAEHRKYERQALKDANKVKKPIRKVSKKRAGETREYLEKKAKYMEIFQICQAKGCGKPSTDLHHRRGRQGSKLTDETLFMALCFDHHEYYTEHSAEAIADGISLLRSVSEPHKI